MEERHFLFSLFITCDLKASVFFWHKSTNYLVEKKTFISIKLINWHSRRAPIQVNCESQPNFYLNKSKLSLEIMLKSLVALKYAYLSPKLFKIGLFLKIEVSMHRPYQFFDQELTVVSGVVFTRSRFESSVLKFMDCLRL